MAIIYSYPEIPKVEGGDLLLISDTGAPSKPTRSVDIDDLALYIGTVIGIGFWNLGTAPDSIFTTKMASVGQDANIASSKFNVYKTEDMTTSVPHVATFNESSSNHSANLWPSPGDNAADIYGSVSRATLTGSGTVDQIIGANPIGRHSGSGSVNFIQGVQTTANLIGSGSANTVVASYAKAFIAGTSSTNIPSAMGAWNAVALNGLNDVDTIYGTYSNVVLTKGDVNDNAIGHFIDFDQVAVDTEVNNAYYIHAKNDSLSVTGEKFFIKDETGIPSQFSNKLVLNAYGSGTFTGAATQRLAVDTNGNVIEIPIGSGPVDGSGTANYTARWIDTDTLGIGTLYDNGTNVGIGTTNPGSKLDVVGNISTSTNFIGDNVIVNKITAATSGGDIKFRNNDGADKVVITNSGNVGIGTTSPGGNLHVVGNAGSSGQIYLSDRDNGTGTGDALLINKSGTNAFIYNRDSGDLRLGSNDQSSMVSIKSTGNVGIGTNSPTVNLQVYDASSSQIKITNGLATPVDLQLFASSSSYAGIGTASDHKLAIRTNGTDKVTVLSNGNVGIGTTAPSQKLHISGNMRLTGAFRDRLNSQGAANYVLTSTGSNGTQWVDASGSSIIGGPYLPLTGGTLSGNLAIIKSQPTLTLVDGVTVSYLQNINGSLYYSAWLGDNIFQSNSGQTMVIKQNGNVGIGTTSPAVKLHVNDSVGGILRLSDTSATADGEKIGGIETGVADGTFFSGINFFRHDSNDGEIRFRTKVNNINTDVMTIVDGNVGIGTTSPVKKLEVNGTFKATGDSSIDGTGNLLIRNSSATGCGITFVDNVWQGGIEHISGNLYFRTGGQVDKMTIKTNGNVGIGTTSPTAKLEVKGGSGVNTTLRVSTDGTATPEPAIQLYRNDVAYGEVSYNAGGNVSGESGLIYTDYRDDASSKHIWKTRNAEKMRLTSVGNVGIGTNSPVQKLHINNSTASSVSYAKFSNAQTGATTADGFDIGVNTGAEAVIWQRENTNLLFATNNSEKMRITSSGILMVGGTTGGYAGTKIHVGNFSDTQNGINILSSTTGYGYVLFGDGTGADTYRGQIAYSHGDDSMVFNTNGSEKLRIVSGGGISFAGATNFGSAGQVLKSNGSASPAWVDASTVIGGPYLPLAGGTMTGNIDFVNNKDISMTDNAGAVTRVMVLNTSNTMYIGPVDTYAGGSILYGVAAGVSYQRFYTGASERMRIGSNGNVAIGTTASSYRLQVEQDSDGNLLSRFHNTAANGQGLLIRAGGVSSANRILQLASENDTKVMTVNSNGRVGIGTTNPAYKLDVDGTIRIGVSGTIQPLLSRDSSTGGLIVSSVGNSGDFIFQGTGGSEKFRIKDTGNVGIGTTSPGSKLQVYSAASSNVFITGYGTSAQNDWGAQNAMFVKTDNGLVISKQNAPNNSNRLYTFYNDASGNAEQYIYNTSNTATIKLDSAGDSYFNGGNVGIGTTSPERLLSLYSNNAETTPRLLIEQDGTGDAVMAFSLTGGQGWSMGIDNSGSDSFMIHNSAGGVDSSSQFTINTNGNVGIGTTSPSNKLHVNSGSTNEVAKFESTDSTAYLSIMDNNTTNSLQGIGSSGNNLTFYSNNAERLRINSVGNVGIGTTSPNAKLNVNGNIKIEGTNSLLFGGSPSVPSWEIKHDGSDLIINDTGTNVGSVLFNNDEGIVLPRLTTTEINAISLPSTGLTVYNTTLNTLCFYNGSSWQKVSHANM